MSVSKTTTDKGAAMETLFDMFSTDQETPRNRGRPKKVQDQKQQSAIQSAKKSKSATTVEDKAEWKVYSESKPDKLVPCKFRVRTDSGYSKIFYGYIQNGGYLCTDDTQLLQIRKHGVLEYSVIPGCATIALCPYGYPTCGKCKYKKG